MLIGINGNKGAGKDTIGKYLIENYDFERLSFAHKLKDLAARLFGIDIDFWEEWKNDDNARIVIEHKKSPSVHIVDISVRTFLQRYGTESHRDIFGDDFWTEALLDKVDVWDGKNYVITDARFANELSAIRKKGGYNVRVIRKNNVEDLHASEVLPPLCYIDRIIDNNGSFDDLYTQIDDFMRDIGNFAFALSSS